MGTKIKLKNVRLSYANLFKARRSDKKDPTSKMKYSTALLIPKSHPQMQELRDAIEENGVEKFGKKWAGMVEEKNPIKDGDAKKFADDPAYKGMWVINANSERKPQIVDRHVQPITDEEEIYSGCWVNATFNVYAFEGETNKGVTFGLNNIQLVKSGEELRIGGVAGADADFDEVEDDEDFPMS
jgi:Protein of unknown function (DUF2815)